VAESVRTVAPVLAEEAGRVISGRLLMGTARVSVVAKTVRGLRCLNLNCYSYSYGLS
jgi:hypothetical protein